MTYAESSEEIKKLLAKYSDTNPEDWYLCLKARFGMSLVLNTLKKTTSETRTEVITTPFTCITAINPILDAKYTPIYASLDSKRLNLQSPEKFINKKTAAIILQNTFGIVPPQQFSISRSKTSPLIIEDAAHSLTRMIKDDKGQPFADISVHSFGVEKILPTKFGAAIYVNPKLAKTKPEFYKKTVQAFKHLKRPNPLLASRLITYRCSNGIINHIPGNSKTKIRHFLGRCSIVETAIKPLELNGRQESPVNTSMHVNKEILKHLKGLSKNLHQRTKNTSFITAALKKNKDISLPNFNSNAPMLVVPILLKTPKKADNLYQKLTDAGFYIRRWYNPPLYPGPAGPNILKNIYHYNAESHPIVKEISGRILCLPTDLSQRRTEKLIKLINK
jgi:dTDP-4-amino-4,6-dideoxygalactose transaminase